VKVLKLLIVLMMKNICMCIYIINTENNVSISFLVNHWFGPNLEEHISVPVINRNEGL
jgi:hypothetical protein